LAAVGGTILVGPATGRVNAFVSGDDGNDRLGLFAERSQLRQSSLILDGGPGFDTCFATQNVALLNCELEVSGGVPARVSRWERDECFT
jgi:hypothetical protein